MNGVNILLIEDNPGDARLIEEMLKEAAPDTHEVQVCYRLATGLKALLLGTFHVVLLDLNLPDSD